MRDLVSVEGFVGTENKVNDVKVLVQRQGLGLGLSVR